jgi:hypothetical protein
MSSAQTTAIELSTEKSEAIERWFKRLRSATVRFSRWVFGEWMKWVTENGGPFADLRPDELVETDPPFAEDVAVSVSVDLEDEVVFLQFIIG